jgi:hypothetical protein
MRVRYGSYRFRIASSELTIRRDPILNAMQQPVAIEEVWSIRSRPYNKTGDATKFLPIMREFDSAFSVNGKDLVLEQSTGDASYHQLLSRNTIGGTRISSGPHFPVGRGPQGLVARDVELEIRGTIPLAASQYMTFTETISIRGGGEKYGIREVNVGPGVRQRLRTHSTCFATQSGSAVGYLGKPQPPPPIWPYALVDEYPDEDITGPQTIGAGRFSEQVNYATSWNYSFAAPYRLFGTPHYLLG